MSQQAFLIVAILIAFFMGPIRLLRLIAGMFGVLRFVFALFRGR